MVYELAALRPAAYSDHCLMLHRPIHAQSPSAPSQTADSVSRHVHVLTCEVHEVDGARSFRARLHADSGLSFPVGAVVAYAYAHSSPLVVSAPRV